MNIPRGLLSFSVVLVALTSSAHPLEHWSPRNGPSYSQTLNGIAYGNGIFVAVGSSLTPTGSTSIGVVLYRTNGIAVSSTNGIGWEARQLNVKQHVNGITYANGRFVAVGNCGTILWSEDGNSWNDVSPPITDTIRTVGYGNPTNAPTGLFVALATTMSLTSTDGIIWKTNSLGSGISGPVLFDAPIASITFGQGRFFALATQNISATSQALISDNGFNWSQLPLWARKPNGVAQFGYNEFVAISWFVSGSPPSVVSVTSSNGFDWSRANLPIGVPMWTPRGLCFDGERFVAVGDAGYTGVSQDGTNWTVEILTNSALRSVTFGEGIYAAVGSGRQVFTSTNGTSWTPRSLPPNQHLLAVESAGDKCIAAGFGGAIAWSTGQFWESSTSPTTNNLRAVLSGQGRYVFAGDFGTIVSGDHLTNLAVRTSGTDKTLNGIVADAETYVIVGDAGTVVSSEDAVDWVTQNSTVANRLTAITYGKGTFVAVGDAGTIVTSGDGKQWTKRTSGTSRSFRDVAFGNGVFVAICAFANGEGGAFVVTSSDGQDWVPVNNSQAGESVIAFGNGFFVYPTYEDATETRLNVSTDGRTWELRRFSPPAVYGPIVNDLTYFAGSFISVANNGAVWQSDPVFKVSWEANNGLGNLIGPESGVYRVQVANELGSPTTWGDLTNLTSFPYIFSDPEASSSPFRFYRARFVE